MSSKRVNVVCDFKFLFYLTFPQFLLSDIYSYACIPLWRVIHAFWHNKHRKVIGIVNICLTPKRHIKTVFTWILQRDAALCPSRLQACRRNNRIQYCCAYNIRLIIVRNSRIPTEWMIALSVPLAGGPYYLIISTVNYESPRFYARGAVVNPRARTRSRNTRDFHYHFHGRFGSHNEPYNRRKTSFPSSSRREIGMPVHNFIPIRVISRPTRSLPVS